MDTDKIALICLAIIGMFSLILIALHHFLHTLNIVIGAARTTLEEIGEAADKATETIDKVADARDQLNRRFGEQHGIPQVETRPPVTTRAQNTEPQQGRFLLVNGTTDREEAPNDCE
ncbi:hypothetical protein [Streptomyces sp. NPDC006739]|uniref:hypothetical protein n=1 Tax=Streptomyces sp. NPDC006739 TaxID=3364763 RepID=UPI003677B4C0